MKTRQTMIPVFMVLVGIMIVSGCGKNGGNPALTGSGGGDEPQGGVIFFDDFEAGGGNWSGDMYWNLTTEQAYSGTASLQAWDSQGVAGLVDLTESFNLTGYTSVTLQFWHKMNILNMAAGGAQAEVLIEIDDSQVLNPWSIGFSVQSQWSQVTISLDDYAGWAQKLEIAFNYEKLQPGTILWWIDDVTITAE